MKPTRAGIIAVAAAFLVLWGANLALFSQSAGDALAFVQLSLFVLVSFVAGGAALAWSAGLDLRKPQEAALAPAIGLLWCDLAYFLSMYAKVPWLFGPLLAAPFVLFGAVLLVRRVRRGASDLSDRSDRSDLSDPSWPDLFRFSWAKVAIVVFVLAWLALTVPRISYTNLTSTPQGLRTVSPYIDQASYLADAAVLKREVPPENHDLAGVPSHYHYFADMLVALLSKATGTEVITVYRFIFPVLLCVLLLALVSLAWRWSRDGWAVLGTCAIVLVGGDFSIYALPLNPKLGLLADARALFGEAYLMNEFWGNAAFSWLNSLPELAGTAVALAALGLALSYREKRRLGLLAAAAIALAMLFKFKSPHFVVMMAGLLIGGAYELWRERGVRLLAVACVAAVLAAPAALSMLGAEDKPTLHLALFPYALYFTRGEPGAWPWLLAVAVAAIGFIGLRFLALVPRKGAGTSSMTVALFGAAAVGLALFFFTVESLDLVDAFNTVWPARLAVTLLAIPAGAGTMTILRARGRLALAGKIALLAIAVPVLAGAAGTLSCYPGFRTGYLHPEAVAEFRAIREAGLPGSRLLSDRRKLFAAAFSEHSWYVNPWGPLAYTRRTSIYRERYAEMQAFRNLDGADAWLRRNRIEFIFTSRAEPLPERLAPAVVPMMTGQYDILWRARWAIEESKAGSHHDRP